MTKPFALLLTAAAVEIAAATTVHAAEVVIPQGTVVFGELEERVTSNENKFRVGYPVDAHVWKDVVVDGRTVIPAGTPLVMRIRDLDARSAGGHGGSIEIMAVSVKALDGTEISLKGGYDKSGGDRTGLTRALSYILWPTGFLPGRQAVLDVGTVFDATIPAETSVHLPDDTLPTLKLPEEKPELAVRIVYDEIDQKAETLPLEITLCNKPFTREAHVVAVNDKEIKPVLIAMIVSKRGDPCHDFRGKVYTEALKKHFKPGINRFTVSMAGADTTIVLNVEM
jgi:hypothetical protein